MQIQIRDQVLDIWRSVISYSYRQGEWHWGGRSGSNSISDAEQLLCILYPATNIPAFRFDEPDETASDVRDALSGLGSELDAPRKMIDLLLEYARKYRSEESFPIFPAGGYVDSDSTLTAPLEQRGLEMVDSFSMSVTLMLSAIGFVRVLRTASRNPGLLRKMDELEALCSERLTAAMIGLLRSFSVNVFDAQSPAGINLLSMVNQAHDPDRIVADRLARSLEDIRASLQKELQIGSGVVAEALSDESLLFQPGWSWGVVEGAPQIKYGETMGGQQPGFADDRPYLYFTVVAMDGIQDLFSDRTRILGLLDEEQQRLAAALRLRWDLTLRFWNRVALFGQGRRWPLEDLPWRTTDGLESDYYSLLMVSMVVQGFGIQLTEPSEDDLVRVGAVLDQLAKRGRITFRVSSDDDAVKVHSPGMQLRLIGTEQFGEQVEWTVSSYSSLLLKRVITVAGLAADTPTRDRLTLLGDQIWEHLRRRRLEDPTAENLWDQPGLALPVSLPPWDGPSWYHTERIVECLVNAADVVEAPLAVSPALSQLAGEFLAEAEHLFDREKLNGTSEAGLSMRRQFEEISDSLARARELIRRQPGTSVMLSSQVLLDLDALAVARLDPHGSG